MTVMSILTLNDTYYLGGYTSGMILNAGLSKCNRRILIFN